MGAEGGEVDAGLSGRVEAAGEVVGAPPEVGAELVGLVDPKESRAGGPVYVPGINE
jgi:hypothetical protein